MPVMRHILICGDVGVGKSTLIEKLLIENRRPVSGFITKRVDAVPSGAREVYIHPAVGERQFTRDNLVGTIDALGAHPEPQAFDVYGSRLLKATSNGLILMDELGFLESRAFVFCNQVLRVLDGDIPVLAAIKTRDTPFLKTVKSHPNMALHEITAENRDDLFHALLPIIKEWNKDF